MTAFPVVNREEVDFCRRGVVWHGEMQTLNEMSRDVPVGRAIGPKRQEFQNLCMSDIVSPPPVCFAEGIAFEVKAD